MQRVALGSLSLPRSIEISISKVETPPVLRVGAISPVSGAGSGSSCAPHLLDHHRVALYNPATCRRPVVAAAAAARPICWIAGEGPFDWKVPPVFDRKVPVFDRKVPVFDRRVPVFDRSEVPVFGAATVNQLTSARGSAPTRSARVRLAIAGFDWKLRARV